MKIRLFGFAILKAINIYITYFLWDTLLISTLPVCLILLVGITLTIAFTGLIFSYTNKSLSHLKASVLMGWSYAAEQ